MGVIFLLRPPTRPPSILTEFSENTTRTFWPFELSLCWWEAILFVVLSPQENKATASKIERIQLNVLYVIVHCSFCCTLLVRSVCVCVFIQCILWLLPVGFLFSHLAISVDFFIWSIMETFHSLWGGASCPHTVITTLLRISPGPLSCDTKVPYHLRKKKNNATSTGWHWSL